LAALTGKWEQPGVPHKGWTCVGIEDLESPEAICQMCEVQPIRYVHTMVHQDYADALECGCVCAGHMEGDYEGARRRETILRNASGRRRRWLSRTWRVSTKGNEFLNASGYNVVVYSQRTGWGFRVTNRESDAYVFSRRVMPTQDAAKLAAFDALVWMQGA
jgi:hypothetical protein